MVMKLIKYLPVEVDNVLELSFPLCTYVTTANKNYTN